MLYDFVSASGGQMFLHLSLDDTSNLHLLDIEEKKVCLAEKVKAIFTPSKQWE